MQEYINEFNTDIRNNIKRFFYDPNNKKVETPIKASASDDEIEYTEPSEICRNIPSATHDHKNIYIYGYGCIPHVKEIYLDNINKQINFINSMGLNELQTISSLVNLLVKECPLVGVKSTVANTLRHSHIIDYKNITAQERIILENIYICISKSKNPNENFNFFLREMLGDTASHDQDVSAIIIYSRVIIYSVIVVALLMKHTKIEELEEQLYIYTESFYKEFAPLTARNCVATSPTYWDDSYISLYILLINDFPKEYFDTNSYTRIIGKYVNILKRTYTKNLDNSLINIQQGVGDSLDYRNLIYLMYIYMLNNVRGQLTKKEETIFLDKIMELFDKIQLNLDGNTILGSNVKITDVYISYIHYFYFLRRDKDDKPTDIKKYEKPLDILIEPTFKFTQLVINVDYKHKMNVIGYKSSIIEVGGKIDMDKCIPEELMNLKNIFGIRDAECLYENHDNIYISVVKDLLKPETSSHDILAALLRIYIYCTFKLIQIDRESDIIEKNLECVFKDIYNNLTNEEIIYVCISNLSDKQLYLKILEATKLKIQIYIYPYVVEYAYASTLLSTPTTTNTPISPYIYHYIVGALQLLTYILGLSDDLIFEYDNKNIEWLRLVLINLELSVKQ